jgi:hypothetical protein
MIRRRWTAGDWLAALIGALLGFVLVAGHRADAQQRRVEAWGGITHTSNLFRGCPLRCGVPELTQDCILGGITLTAGRRRSVGIDLSHGLCRFERGPLDQASQLSVRFYPGRARGL